MSWLYDSHIHLSDPEYESDIEQIIHTMELLKLKQIAINEIKHISSSKQN